MTIQKIDSLEDRTRDVVTYELPDGRRVKVSGSAVRLDGVHKVLFAAGLIDDPATLPAKPLYWCGKMVGMLPGDFDPAFMRSRSMLYEPRPGDIVAGAEGWSASRTLGSGDISSIVGLFGPPVVAVREGEDG